MRRDCKMTVRFSTGPDSYARGVILESPTETFCMLCPSCGGIHNSRQCSPSVTVSTTALSLQNPESEFEEVNFDPSSENGLSLKDARPVSRLIEFPGVTRRAVPQWRKELSERVREVQERRAREAASEREEAQRRLASSGNIVSKVLSALE